MLTFFMYKYVIAACLCCGQALIIYLNYGSEKMESKAKNKVSKGWKEEDLHALLERVDRRITENREIIEEMLRERSPD
ncbi:MAG: hypothetical protein ACOC4M_17095 [Promethearchaeia archaeon]